MCRVASRKTPFTEITTTVHVDLKPFRRIIIIALIKLYYALSEMGVLLKKSHQRECSHYTYINGWRTTLDCSVNETNSAFLPVSFLYRFVFRHLSGAGRGCQRVCPQFRGQCTIPNGEVALFLAVSHQEAGESTFLRSHGPNTTAVIYSHFRF